MPVYCGSSSSSSSSDANIREDVKGNCKAVSHVSFSSCSDDPLAQPEPGEDGWSSRASSMGRGGGADSIYDEDQAESIAAIGDLPDGEDLGDDENNDEGGEGGGRGRSQSAHLTAEALRLEKAKNANARRAIEECDLNDIRGLVGDPSTIGGDGTTRKEGEGTEKDDAKPQPAAVEDASFPQVAPVAEKLPDTVDLSTVSKEPFAKIESTIIRGAMVTAGAIPESPILDAGATVCLKDGTVVGAVATLLGPVKNCCYAIACNRGRFADLLSDEKLAEDTELYFGKPNANLIFDPEQVKREELARGRGATDASYVNDLELPDHVRPDFSDDEKEMEWKAQRKEMKRAKARGEDVTKFQMPLGYGNTATAKGGNGGFGNDEGSEDISDDDEKDKFVFDDEGNITDVLVWNNGSAGGDKGGPTQEGRRGDAGERRGDGNDMLHKKRMRPEGGRGRGGSGSYGNDRGGFSRGGAPRGGYGAPQHQQQQDGWSSGGNVTNSNNVSVQAAPWLAQQQPSQHHHRTPQNAHTGWSNNNAPQHQHHDRRGYSAQPPVHHHHQQQHHQYLHHNQHHNHNRGGYQQEFNVEALRRQQPQPHSGYQQPQHRGYHHHHHPKQQQQQQHAPPPANNGWEVQGGALPPSASAPPPPAPGYGGNYTTGNHHQHAAPAAAPHAVNSSYQHQPPSAPPAAATSGAGRRKYVAPTIPGASSTQQQQQQPAAGGQPTHPGGAPEGDDGEFFV